MFIIIVSGMPPATHWSMGLEMFRQEAMYPVFPAATSALAANPTVVTLKPGKTYKSYDITGDKKPDTIRIIKEEVMYDDWENSMPEGLRIFVNGRQAYVLDEIYFYLDIKLFTLENGVPYLYIDVTGDDYWVAESGLFRYQNGALKKSIDFHKVARKCGVGQRADVRWIKGNTLTVDYFVNAFSFATSKVRYYYRYSNGSLKQTSQIGTFQSINFKSAPRSLTTRIKLTAYKSQTSGQKAFTIPAGKSIRIDKCYWNKNYMRFRVRYNGRYGWVKAATSTYEKNNVGSFSRQFKNVRVDW